MRMLHFSFIVALCAWVGGTCSTSPATAEPKIAGFVAAARADRGVTLFDLDGQAVAELRAPDLRASEPGCVHLAGAWRADASLPLIFCAFEQGDTILRRNVNDAIAPVAATRRVFKLAGAPAQPILAYSTAEETAGRWLTQLFVGTSETLATAQPVLTLTEPAGEALAPLALTTARDRVVGVWYTFEPARGGEFAIFQPRRGLYYLDLVAGANREILNRETNPSALSPDRSWVSYAANDDADAGPLTIRNLITGHTVTFPRLAQSDRGAGSAAFAPDNRHVAWMEGRGHWHLRAPPTFEAYVRIASTTGAIVAEFPVSAINGVGGVRDVFWMAPVGWLDARTVLVQIGPNARNPVALARINSDGSGLAYLAPGRFAGWVYR